ncbi:hypothetical protein E2C01_066591 [Portunus trituberculatus]|uniref:Uncharacterized protein n=1 Tax=Portunus trituberculatus TaxID=210409 RepID=A0A5B7HLY1_PORTR|nr:hypothetical protein [Portunus trituberculatus]
MAVLYSRYFPWGPHQSTFLDEQDYRWYVVGFEPTRGCLPDPTLTTLSTMHDRIFYETHPPPRRQRRADVE